jgi:YjbE family integral membrane protein
MPLLPTIGSIILIDLVLSGDNTLVIGVAAHRLPPRQRRIAVVAGGALAIALRILFTLIAAFLLRVPYLHLVGGLLLLGVAAKVIREEEELERGLAAPGKDGLWPAILTIVFADAAMSLDNVLGVAGAAGDDLTLLVLGLVLSMALMILAGNAIANLLNRYRWLAYLGAAVIAWTGAAMALRDPALAGNATLEPWLPLLSLLAPATAATLAVVVPAVAAFTQSSRRAAKASRERDVPRPSMEL